MITHLEAMKKITIASKILPTQIVALIDSLGHCLAQDIRSNIDLPTMDNSAMDGYVLRSKDTPGSLMIKKPIKAGSLTKLCVKAGEAHPIMTGAKIPQGADTILVKEKAMIQDGNLVVDHHVLPKMHIRRKGEEIKKGTKVLSKGEVIHPGTITVLASLGVAKVRVFKKPNVTVIATGSELVQPGKKIQSGQIFDSNSSMLRALLISSGIKDIRSITLKDQMHLIRKAICKNLKESDVLILAGGVSVGDYDFVKEVLEKEGVKRVFWRVDQKPGKPLYFGVRGKTLVFGLPGNPASAYICYAEYVYPALRKMAGLKDITLPVSIKKNKKTIKRGKRRIQYLKAKTSSNSDSVEVLGGQGSHMVAALHHANCLVAVDRNNHREVGENEGVSIHRLPWV